MQVCAEQTNHEGQRCPGIALQQEQKDSRADAEIEHQPAQGSRYEFHLGLRLIWATADASIVGTSVNER